MHPVLCPAGLKTGREIAAMRDDLKITAPREISSGHTVDYIDAKTRRNDLLRRPRVGGTIIICQQTS